MTLQCGIVGLPNVGKSTVFNALTLAGVPAENYPFCTVEPNVGTLAVPDPRLDKLIALLKPERVVPSVLEFVDIAGLVRNAHKGEGLGNQFLGHIRTVDAIAHVVRCFEDAKVPHPEGAVDPVRDAETVAFELIQKDLETVERRLEKSRHMLRVGDKAIQREVETLELMKAHLLELKPLRLRQFAAEDQPLFKEMARLTGKPLFYIANLGEESVAAQDHAFLEKLKQHAQAEGMLVVAFWGKLEAEIRELAAEEQEAFRQEMGLKESGIPGIVRTGYQALDLITFYTKVGPELRAWTIPRATPAPRAAGKIHSDMEKGFIKAEVISFKELTRIGSESEARHRGLLRQEGKDYLIQDGDVVHFRFNV